MGLLDWLFGGSGSGTNLNSQGTFYGDPTSATSAGFVFPNAASQNTQYSPMPANGESSSVTQKLLDLLTGSGSGSLSSLGKGLTDATGGQPKTLGTTVPPMQQYSAAMGGMSSPAMRLNAMDMIRQKLGLPTITGA